MKNELLLKILVIGIILLFICMSVYPSTAIDNMKKSSVPISKGNILYVGGDGPNNYTRIQDAIDNATSGDTVYVYDDSSPYAENIVVDTSISLFGEDKNTTIIDGSVNGHGANIVADNVTIFGFTIQNCSYGYAICLSANNSCIIDNIISNNMIGISPSLDNPSIFLRRGYNTIANNLIINNERRGIDLIGINNTVYRNIISQNPNGIELGMAVENNISNNFISDNEYGIFIYASYNSIIYNNNISLNEKLGILIFMTSSDKILQNNFIANGQNAYFNQPLIARVWAFKKFLSFPIRRSIWDRNFWDRPRLMPYKIPGLISLIRGNIEAPYIFNIYQFDWRPAKEPYDISI